MFSCCALLGLLAHILAQLTLEIRRRKETIFFYFKRKSRTNSKEGKRVSHTHSTGGIMKLRKKTSHLLREITIHNFLEARASEHISHTLLSQPTEAGLLCVILALRKLLEIIEIVWWSSSFVVVVVAHSVAITWRQSRFPVNTKIAVFCFFYDVSGDNSHLSQSSRQLSIIGTEKAYQIHEIRVLMSQLDTVSGWRNKYTHTFSIR